MAKSRKTRTPGMQETDPDVEGGSQPITPQRRTTPHDEVSPAGTFDTMPMSPASFDGSLSSPKPQKITIEHNVKSSSTSAPRSAGLLLGMTKPAMAIVGLLLLGGAGAATFGWFQIPGLNDQIEELEAQVALLSTEVDRLATENNRYENLNNQLNDTVADFRYLNEELNTTVIELEEVAGELNKTNLELLARVSELAEENENYARLNDELNATAIRLAEEVDFFEIALARLVLENGALTNTTEALQGLTLELGNLTSTQNQTLTEMAGVLGNLTAENDRLENLNSDLVSIVTFLNETTFGLDDSLQQITSFLADQIVANKVLLSETLENTYRQRVQNWDCDYRDHFREEPFGENFNVVITNLTAAVDYVDDRVLSELCLDPRDFEEYLLEEYPEGVTSYRLITGVNTYTTQALTFYFPEVNADGISAEQWAEAGYSCRNLQEKYTDGSA